MTDTATEGICIQVTILRVPRARRRSLSIAGLIAIALTASACAGSPASTPGSAAANAGGIIDQAACDRNQAVGPITYISGYGYSASAGQMDVFLAKELGYFNDLCLDVEINASGANGQQLVSSGQGQFTALGSASDVMLAAANSHNLTAIATYGDVSPFSIFTNENITSLKDLEGKKLGYFINMTPIALAMLDAAGVDVSKVELIKMTNYDPTVVTRGQVDAIVGYASNQPEKLKSLNLPFNQFLPQDLDIQGTYNVMEVNSKFLKDNREVVSDFMRASLKALQYCLDNDAECIDMISKLAEANNQGSAFPKDQQERTWKVESGWVEGDAVGKPGVQTIAEWEAEYELVKRFGGVKELPPLKDMMDVDLVADLYDGDTLIWPSK
jgi:ABC-type nitrate/sulfonate/bicarbonate transport system substrate-binding protein